MPSFEFDSSQRRAYQEPQTTKKELLREPRLGPDHIYGTTPNGGAGLSDLLATKSGCDFDSLDRHNKHQTAPYKQGVLPPPADANRQKRAYSDETLHEGISKRVKDTNNTARVPSLTTSSDERYGRHTGVIDLTGDSEESDQDQGFPARQFVPDAEGSKPAVRRTSPSPPRTFVRGLSPIAAHPRKAPVMSRCKPPIKPASRRQTQTASPGPLNVFNAQHRSQTVGIEGSRRTTPVARSTPRAQVKTSSLGTSSIAKSETPRGLRKSGPFLEVDDDSSGDESMAPPARLRDSVSILVDRPKCDTPVRADISRLQAESRSMREKAQQKLQSGEVAPAVNQTAQELAISDDLEERDAVEAWRDCPVPSIEFPPDPPPGESSEGTDPTLVRPQQHESTETTTQRIFANDGPGSGSKPRHKTQHTIAETREAKESVYSRPKPAFDFQRLVEKAQSRNKAVSKRDPNPFIPAKRYNAIGARHHIDSIKSKVAQEKQNVTSTGSQGCCNRIRSETESSSEDEAWEEREVAEKRIQRSAPVPPRLKNIPHGLPFPPSKSPLGTAGHQKNVVKGSIMEELKTQSRRAQEQRIREKKARDEQSRAEQNDTSPELVHKLVKSKAPEVHDSGKMVYHRGNGARPVSAVEHQPESPIFDRPEVPTAQGNSDETESEPTERPKGPFSLNSVQGVKAVAQLLPRQMVLPYEDERDAKPAIASLKKGEFNTASFKKSAASTSSLTITPIDLQLYRWRVEKVQWADVIRRYNELTGTRGAREDNLRNRFRQIEKAIEREEISNELCVQALAGDQEALDELNRLVREQHASEPTPFKKVVKQEPAPLARIQASEASAPRPTQGGKSYDMTIQAYFQHVKAMEIETEDEDSSRECSPMTEADYVHWQYFLLRRNFTVEELAEGDKDDLFDNTEWVEYDVAFESLSEANATAARFVFAAPKDAAPACEPSGKFSIVQNHDEDGLVSFELTSNAGLVQVKVSRRMRSFQEHVEPESKEGWLPKRFWCVHVRTLKKEADDLFGEGTNEVAFRVLENAVFTTLDLANSRAMDEWLRLTHVPSSSHLDVVQMERAAAKAQLEEALNSDGGDVTFSDVFDDEHRTVEVKVEVLHLQGPRN